MKNLKITPILLITLLTAALAQAQSTESIALQGSQLFPEGIVTLPNNDLLVGGFGDGSIQKIDSKNNVSYFSQSGQNGMVIAVGFAVDKKIIDFGLQILILKQKAAIPAAI